MDTNIILGFLLILLGAACGGSFGLPSKYVKKDTPWEVLWGPFFFITTIIIPVVMGPAVVKSFTGIYGEAGLAKMLPVLIFGLLWGLGSMTLGMSFAFIGLSLAYSLNYGAQIAFGSMMPMILHNADKICTPQGYMLMAGVATCLVGVVVSGRAGMLKEQDAREETGDTGGGVATQTAVAIKSPKMLIGLLVGVASGILCACYSVAWSYAGPIQQVARAKGNIPFGTEFAVMALILWGGAVSSCLYCMVQLAKNKTWGRLAQPSIVLVLVLATAMAILHDSAILLFGLGAGRLGKLGGSVGYAAFMSFAIIVGNIHGFRTGEWKQASPRSVKWIVAGIVVLIVGVCLLAKANAMA